MKVKDCFVLSVELCILMERLAKYRFELLHLSKLKPKIQKLFPDKAQLSEKGQKLFAPILPKNTHESHGFAIRIAAGFTRIWEEREWNDSRQAMEYLSRRNLSIQNTNAFVHETDDILWFLWGVCSMYYHKHIEKIWQLFYWNYNTKMKADRLGLLWIAPMLGFVNIQLNGVQLDVADVLTSEELTILNKVKNSAKELWIQLDQVLKEQAKDDEFNILNSYMPRVQMEQVILPPHEEKTKQIKLRKSKELPYA